MNYLKTSLKVNMNMLNPYKIKSEFKLLCESPSVQQSLNPSQTVLKSKLQDRTQLNSDYHILRFALPDQNKCLGLKIGQYLWIELSDGTKRPYVPISRIDELGYVDILLRDLTHKNIGSFTQKLLKLPLQSQAKIIAPGTQFLYEGYGKISYLNQKNSQVVSKQYKNIGIITHSSAITTTYSLIQSVAINYDRRTGVSLLWLGDQESDFMLLDELLGFQEQYKLNMNLMLMGMQTGIKYGVKMKNNEHQKNQQKNNMKEGKAQNSMGWLGPYGKVMEKHIKQYMPFTNSNQIIIMSGLQGQLAYIPELIRNMGYKDYLNF